MLSLSVLSLMKQGWAEPGGLANLRQGQEKKNSGTHEIDVNDANTFIYI